MKLKHIFIVIVLAATTLFFTLQILSPAYARVEPEQIRAVTQVPVVDDFESGFPVDWFQYGDYGNGTAITTTLAMTDGVPGLITNTVMSIDYVSAGWGAGTGRNLGGEDWSQYDGFSFWFYGSDSAQTYRVILSDNLNDTLPGDTAERFAFEFNDVFTGWQHINIPWHAFFRDYAYQPPGAPDDGLTLTDTQAYAMALPLGTRATYLDQVQLVQYATVDDFESGFPADWFQYGDYGNGTAITTTLFSTDTIPGLITNTVLSIDYVSAGWGAGTGHNLGGSDWSAYDGFSFWFYGQNSNAMYRVILSDNLNDTLPGDTAERFAYEFFDDFNGWQHISIPWAEFFRDYAYQPPGAPDDGLTLTEMQAYAFALPLGQRETYVDNVAVFGDGQVPLAVSFTGASTSVAEGAATALTVTLNMTASYPVTVTYATVDGTAVAGDDYTAVSSTLVFPPATTQKVVLVTTLDDNDYERNETFTLRLSAPVSVTLGNPRTAVITIVDDEQPTSGNTHLVIVDDYEITDLPMGMDGSADIGWVTWNAPAASSAITVTPVVSNGVPEPVPGLGEPNQVLQLDTNVGSGQWAGFTHAFADETTSIWTPQDWRGYEGVSFWLYGNNTGATLFLDILDNRNPGSISDDAERWSIDIPDDFSGWQYFEIPFTDLHRKDIGNGAPNDGLTLTAVHGYGIGVFGSVNVGAQTNYVDQVALIVRTTVIDDYEITDLPMGMDGSADIGWVTWNAPAASSAITVTPVVSNGVPEPVPGLGEPNQVLQLDTNVGSGQWAGFTHAFADETTSIWTPQDWRGYEGVSFWLYGNNTGATLFLDILDNRNPGSISDDAERWSIDIPDDFSGWQYFEIPFTDLHRKDIGNGAPNDGLTLTAVHGYGIGVFGSVNVGAQTNYVDQVVIYGNVGGGQVLEVAFDQSSFAVTEAGTAVITVSLNMTSTDPVTVAYYTAESYATPDRDFIPAAGTLVIPAGTLAQTFAVPTLTDTKYEGDENVMLVLADPVNAALGFRYRTVLSILDDDAFDPALVHDFEGYHSFAATTGDVTLSTTELVSGTGTAIPGQDMYENVLTAAYDTTVDPAQFAETFAQGQDWSGYEGVSFWYEGSNSGDTIMLELLDNQITTTATIPPADWTLVWHDEFTGTAGMLPDPNVWRHELGDGMLNGISGWGNSESEYYSDSPDNASLDGNGNLAITLQQVSTDTTDLACWYGPCEYTSARLISADRMEYEYGRMEARIQVPSGGDGLWPAFWMLGTDIGEVGWPQSGEIDIMEYVSRIPTEVFGTLHGPGYSGGNAFGSTYNFGVPVSQTYHVFSIEWGPDEIHWYVDGINFHNATPADVAPNEWVYNHTFYMILNLAIGGNFGGSIDPNLVFPQQMLVDYVRVYQGENTSERFEASFVDNFTGWQQVRIPFADLVRSAEQPTGAPDDGLTLTDVWGYGLKLPDGTSGSLRMDRIYLETSISDIAPTDVTVVGPATGVVSTTYTFTATVNPVMVTTPLTFTWTADGQTPVVHVVNGLVDTVSFTWIVTGTNNVTVTVSNAAGSVMETQVIVISAVSEPEYLLFLPVVMKP